eukprot:jgi/Ulvmu1/11904/UM081_0063.1
MLMQGPGTFTQAVKESLEHVDVTDDEVININNLCASHLPGTHLFNKDTRPSAVAAAHLTQHHSQDPAQAHPHTEVTALKPSPLPVIDGESLTVTAAGIQRSAVRLQTPRSAAEAERDCCIPNVKLASACPESQVQPPIIQARPDRRSTVQILGLVGASELQGCPTLPIVSPTPPPSAQTEASGGPARFLPSRGASGARAQLLGQKHHHDKPRRMSCAGLHQMGSPMPNSSSPICQGDLYVPSPHTACQAGGAPEQLSIVPRPAAIAAETIAKRVSRPTM